MITKSKGHTFHACMKKKSKNRMSNSKEGANGKQSDSYWNRKL